jgi:hypothetical protein
MLLEPTAHDCRRTRSYPFSFLVQPMSSTAMRHSWMSTPWQWSTLSSTSFLGIMVQSWPTVRRIQTWSLWDVHVCLHPPVRVCVCCVCVRVCVYVCIALSNGYPLGGASSLFSFSNKLASSLFVCSLFLRRIVLHRPLTQRCDDRPNGVWKDFYHGSGARRGGRHGGSRTPPPSGASDI